MKIFVAGSWHKNKIKKIEKEIEKIGKLVAEKNCILITGGGTGVSEIAAKSYLENGGKVHIVYDVASRFRKMAGEKRGAKAQKIIRTGEDYLVRNNIMIRNCDLMIAFNGGLGVWGEILSAAGDYKKKVIIFEKGFDNLNCLKRILGGRKNVFYVKEIAKIEKFI